MDPFVEWVQLGEDITDGIMAWISIGIDPSVDDEVEAAATIFESGGVANEDYKYTGGLGGEDAPDGKDDTSSGTAPPS
jgi:hypothetical protein